MSWHEEDCKPSQGLRYYSICCYLQTHVKLTVLSVLLPVIECFWTHVYSDFSKGKLWLFRTIFLHVGFLKAVWHFWIPIRAIPFADLHCSSCVVDAGDISSSQRLWPTGVQAPPEWCFCEVYRVYCPLATTLPSRASCLNYDHGNRIKRNHFLITTFNYGTIRENCVFLVALSLSLRPPGYTGWGEKAFKDCWGSSEGSTQLDHIGKAPKKLTILSTASSWKFLGALLFRCVSHQGS